VQVDHAHVNFVAAVGDDKRRNLAPLIHPAGHRQVGPQLVGTGVVADLALPVADLEQSNPGCIEALSPAAMASHDDLPSSSRR
jgi:hypothetical protein